MAGYHRFVFDEETRTFVGRFEEMYQEEKLSNFDSWHQDDSRQLNRNIALEICASYNFGSVLDIGVGKGSLTHEWKRRNNVVLGLDISPTAIDVARARFPDIAFEVADANDIPLLSAFLSERLPPRGYFDLAVSAECLSYLENWRQLLSLLAGHARFLLINLYLPEDPIGFVKSPDQLEAEVERHFEVLESVWTKKSRFIVLFARSLHEFEQVSHAGL